MPIRLCFGDKFFTLLSGDKRFEAAWGVSRETVNKRIAEKIRVRQEEERQGSLEGEDQELRGNG